MQVYFFWMEKFSCNKLFDEVHGTGNLSHLVKVPFNESIILLN